MLDFAFNMAWQLFQLPVIFFLMHYCAVSGGTTGIHFIYPVADTGSVWETILKNIYFLCHWHRKKNTHFSCGNLFSYNLILIIWDYVILSMAKMII